MMAKLYPKSNRLSADAESFVPHPSQSDTSRQPDLLYPSATQHTENSFMNPHVTFGDVAYASVAPLFVQQTPQRAQSALFIPWQLEDSRQSWQGAAATQYYISPQQHSQPSPLSPHGTSPICMSAIRMIMSPDSSLSRQSTSSLSMPCCIDSASDSSNGDYRGRSRFNAADNWTGMRQFSGRRKMFGSQQGYSNWQGTSNSAENFVLTEEQKASIWSKSDEFTRNKKSRVLTNKLNDLIEQSRREMAEISVEQEFMASAAAAHNPNSSLELHRDSDTIDLQAMIEEFHEQRTFSTKSRSPGKSKQCLLTAHNLNNNKADLKPKEVRTKKKIRKSNSLERDKEAEENGGLISQVESAAATPAVVPSPLTSPHPVIANIHSSRFREYCDHVLTKDLDVAVFNLMSELVRAQDRVLHAEGAASAKQKRRFVMGLRETMKHARSGAVTCCFIAPNLEKAKSHGGIDAALQSLIKSCKDADIPYVFCLSRHTMGRICSKLVPISVIGVLDYSGAEKYYEDLLTLRAKAVGQYSELLQIAMNRFVVRPGPLGNHGHSRNPSNISLLSFISNEGSEEATARGHSRNPSNLEALNELNSELTQLEGVSGSEESREEPAEGDSGITEDLAEEEQADSSSDTATSCTSAGRHSAGLSSHPLTVTSSQQENFHPVDLVVNGAIPRA